MGPAAARAFQEPTRVARPLEAEAELAVQPAGSGGARVGASYLIGLAVDANYVYWTNNGTNTIGRANLDGSSPNQSFITAASSPYGVAVDAG